MNILKSGSNWTLWFELRAIYVPRTLEKADKVSNTAWCILSEDAEQAGTNCHNPNLLGVLSFNCVP